MLSGGLYNRVFFFFQAEDGIRDIGVTGVQTCALPISEDLAVAAIRSSVANPLPWRSTAPNVVVGYKHPASLLFTV